MAGLQQYYFFPTDFFYPRPQPSTSTLETSSVQQNVVPLQTIKEETKKNNQKQRMIIAPPPSHALVLTPKEKGQSFFDKKLSTHSTKILSWDVSTKEDEGRVF
ncbi:hypothetical protein VNO78_02628 [Psophocarpus tetragonolobus]|uniref:Uncharacterized protein n=1 Tax=Psophocarpus tetragonolobus TaxID=3891 RepID=A0AAN9XV72_PSOTE